MFCLRRDISRKTVVGCPRIILNTLFYVRYWRWDRHFYVTHPNPSKVKPFAEQRHFLPPGIDQTLSNMILGTLRSDDSDGNENINKAIGLITKTTILHVHHAFLYISLPSLQDYDVKMPNLTFYIGSTQVTTKFPLSF